MNRRGTFHITPFYGGPSSDTLAPAESDSKTFSWLPTPLAAMDSSLRSTKASEFEGGYSACSARATREPDATDRSSQPLGGVAGSCGSSRELEALCDAACLCCITLSAEDMRITSCR